MSSIFQNCKMDTSKTCTVLTWLQQNVNHQNPMKKTCKLVEFDAQSTHSRTNKIDSFVLVLINWERCIFFEYPEYKRPFSCPSKSSCHYFLYFISFSVLAVRISAIYCVMFSKTALSFILIITAFGSNLNITKNLTVTCYNKN